LAPETISPQLDELRRALGDLFAARRRLQGREKRRAGELTLTQCIALVRIDRDGETTAGQLADAAGLNPASVTAMLDQLEESGVIERTRSAADKRVVLVSLTDKGSNALNDTRAYWNRIWESEFAGVSSEELLVAAAIIDKVSAVIDDAFLAD
jgi:DNA-binding MarR family transcriptional regulator